MRRHLVLIISLFLTFFLFACKNEEVNAYDDIASDVLTEHSDGHNSNKLIPETDTQTEAVGQNEADDSANSDAQVDELPAVEESVPEESVTEEPVIEEPVEEEPIEEEPKIINPLTGEETDVDLSHQRPYAIMIDNSSGALPQDGISYADILYEVTAYAGGATRCMGIYQDISVTDIIGGIRSARVQFADIAVSYDALYVHYGAAQVEYNRIYKTGVDLINGMSYDWFYREPWRAANVGYTHSVVADTEAVLSGIVKRDYRLEHEEGFNHNLTFAQEVDLTGSVEATSIEVNIGGNKSTFFEFDPETELYLASQYGDKWIDHATGEQLAFTNILFIHMNSYTSGDYQIHDTLEGGTGYYLNNGRLVEITWSRDSIDSPFRYFYSDGTPIVLGVGKTYIGVYTADGYVKWE